MHTHHPATPQGKGRFIYGSLQRLAHLPLTGGVLRLFLKADGSTLNLTSEAADTQRPPDPKTRALVFTATFDTDANVLFCHFWAVRVGW